MVRRLVFVCLIALANWVMAQSILKGVVTDEGGAIPGATVRVLGTVSVR